MSVDGSFLGRGWAFPPAFDGRPREARMAAREEDVRQALRILFSTIPGERVMHPTYGCDLHALVFETVSEGTLTEIRTAIERAILFHEPRITLESVEPVVADALQGRLDIRIEYTIRETNTRANMVYPFYLSEGGR